MNSPRFMLLGASSHGYVSKTRRWCMWSTWKALQLDGPLAPTQMFVIFFIHQLSFPREVIISNDTLIKNISPNLYRVLFGINTLTFICYFSCVVGWLQFKLLILWYKIVSQHAFVLISWMLQGCFHVMEYWPLKQNVSFLINANILWIWWYYTPWKGFP